MHKVEMRHQENGEAEEELVVSNLRPFTLKARVPSPAAHRLRTACAPRDACASCGRARSAFCMHALRAESVSTWLTHVANPRAGWCA